MPTLEEQLQTIDTDIAARVGYQVYVEYEIEGDTYEDDEQVRWCDTFPVWGIEQERLATHQRVLDHVRSKFAAAEEAEQKMQLLQVSVYWYHPRDGHVKLHTIKAKAADLPPPPVCSHCGARKPQRRSEAL